MSAINHGPLTKLKNTIKNSFNDRAKKLRFEVENKRGVFNQISTIDISDIFKSLTGWEDGSNSDIEGSINPTFGCLHIKKLTGNEWSEWRYNFSTPLVITNNAKYLRFWVNIPDVSTLQNIDFYLYSNISGGSNTHRQNIPAASLVSGPQFIDLPVDRLKLQGSGSPDIYGAGIDRISFLVRATNTSTETEFSVDKMEFIERKPFFIFFMDDTKEENTEDVSPYLISKDMPWNVSIPHRNIEKWHSNPESPGSFISPLSVVQDLVQNHNMYCGMHLYAVAFPPVEITQAGAGGTPEVTDFHLYDSQAVFTNEAIKTHVDRHAGKYFLLSSPTVDYYVWFNKDGGSADPAVADRTGIEVAIATGDDIDDIGGKAATAIDNTAAFSASYTDKTITATNAANGAVLSIPEVGNCPWGVVGFRECLRWTYNKGVTLGLWKNHYLYNAWATNSSVTKEYNRIARAYSNLLRYTNDDPDTNTAQATLPVFSQGNMPFGAAYFRYINQYTHLHNIRGQVLDNGYTAEQIAYLFDGMIEHQVQTTIYTHGTQRNQEPTRTPIETLEAFFRVYANYRGRIDCLSPKQVREMYDQVQIINNPQDDVGGDSVYTPLSYRIKDEEDIVY